MDNNHLLVVNNLHTSFEVPAGEVRSVSGISFTLDKGKILGIVGESGSGKSVTAASIMQILVSPGHIKSGSSVVFEGEELVGMNEKDLRKIRGDKIAMIFQDPMTALNPVFTIGHQMEEAMLLHKHERIDILLAPFQKTLRDHETESNRLKESLKEAEKAEKKDEESIKTLSSHLEEIEKLIVEDKVILESETVKAQAQVDYEKTVAKTKYNYEVKKRFLTFKNALRGAITEVTQENSRFENEKASALREPGKKEKERASLAIALKIEQDKIEWQKVLLPETMIMKTSSLEGAKKEEEEKKIAEINQRFAKIIEADQEAYEASVKNEEEYYKASLAMLKKEHRARQKQLRKTRHQTIKKAFIDLINAHKEFKAQFGVTRYYAKKKSIEMLTLVGVNEPEKRMKQYPFEFSGGMLQRVMIAMALLSSPDLLIADEPTTALDVTIQAQILELIKDIQAKLGMGVIIITHDLGVVAQICDEVDVMYAGRIVESGLVDDIFYNPKHEYTKGLMTSIPGEDASKGQKLHPIEGNPVDVFALPKGCSFAPRCEKCLKVCLEVYPSPREIGPTHKSSCFYSAYEEVKNGTMSKKDFIAYLNQGFVVDTNNAKKEKESLIKKLAKEITLKKEEISKKAKAKRKEK